MKLALRLLVWLGVLAGYVWVFRETDFSFSRLGQGLPWMWDFLRRMVPPDPSVLGSAFRGALETVEIALAGTTLASILAVPLGFLSARNSVRSALFYPVRSVLNFFRSIDTLVYGLLFVASVGLGPFPGVLAVTVYTTMVLAKLYSEAIEGIDPGPVEAVTATGASKIQILRYGVFPQVLPICTSYVLYRFETNIRAAAVLGFVGAGGIGFYIQTYLRMMNYPAASSVLLVLVGMVMVVDFTSSQLRKRLV